MTPPLINYHQSLNLLSNMLRGAAKLKRKERETCMEDVKDVINVTMIKPLPYTECYK